MNSGPEKLQAEFASELERQRRDLIKLAQGKGLSLTLLMAAVWPMLLIAFAGFNKDFSSAEQLIALGTAVGLLSLLTAFEHETNSRMRALLRLLDHPSRKTS